MSSVFWLLTVLAVLVGFGSVVGVVLGIVAGVLVGIIIIFAHNEILLSWECEDSICGAEKNIRAVKAVLRKKQVYRFSTLYYNVTESYVMKNVAKKFEKVAEKVLTYGGGIAIITEQNKEG